MDFGKFKFDEAQRAKESRRKTTSSSIKEMKYRPKIGVGDFDTKTRQVSKFLADGHKVKITIMFRGREMSHPELGKKLLDHVAEQVVGFAKIEAAPKLDGRNMIMVLAPDRRAGGQAAAAPRAAAKAGSRPPSAPTPPPTTASATTRPAPPQQQAPQPQAPQPPNGRAPATAAAPTAATPTTVAPTTTAVPAVTPGNAPGAAEET